ncbi:MAG TPA: DUF72 domain-containing protein [Solirubrobacteraceae bacterium]|nr:DUF72 domain-containing protein [Solirubrobacteraceae bacterium]
MTLLAGASGFSFASWRPGFYPAGTRSDDFLSYYAERLPAVELNGTFYRQPAVSTLERWAASVPDGFRFAVKAPRTISIFGRADFAPEFSARIRSLGDRLGAVLVRFDERRERDDDFLRALLEGFDADLWLALDFRHPSWDGAESLLDERAVRVNQLESPAPFRYLRLREPPYDDEALRGLADRVRPMLDAGLAVHVYFRHEDEPTAPAYAARLLELVREAA